MNPFHTMGHSNSDKGPVNEIGNPKRYGDPAVGIRLCRRVQELMVESVIPTTFKCNFRRTSPLGVLVAC